MALGPRDKSNLVMLTGWDADRLKAFDLEQKTDYFTVVQMLNAGLGALNAELANHPVWGSAVSFQDEPDVEYRVGSSNGFEVHTEYARPDAKRAKTEGHMLPIIPYDRMLGWTWEFLEEARMSQLEADIADALKDARDIYRQKLLGRVLKRTDDSGSNKGLGSSGYSPGFTTADGSTSVDFTPPSVDGNSFSSGHEHYVADAGGWDADIFTAARNNLREHGHPAPYEMWISEDDQATVEAITGFTAAPEMSIRYGNDTSIATLSREVIAGAYYIGTLKDFNIRVVPGMPQYYGFGFKSYGVGSQRNPLRLRVPKNMSQIQFIAIPDPTMGNGQKPIQNLMLYAKFGVGVYDRTNGVPHYVNNATWSDGTAS